MTDKLTEKKESQQRDENFKQKYNINFNNDDNEISSSISEDNPKILNNMSTSPLKSALKSPKNSKITKNIGFNEGKGVNDSRNSNREKYAITLEKESKIDQEVNKGINDKFGDNLSDNEFIIERTRIRANWLKNKGSEDYFKFLLNGFYLMTLKSNFHETEAFDEKESLLVEIKNLERECSFHLIKKYNDKFLRSLVSLRETLLILENKTNIKSKKGKKFCLQKFGRKLGKMLYRYIEIQGYSEKERFTKTVSLLSAKININSSPVLFKSKKYQVPKAIIIENKADFAKQNNSSLQRLSWSSKEVIEYEYRVLLIYSENSFKSNKAIYARNPEEAKKLLNFFTFQCITDQGFNFGQKIGKFSTFYKVLASIIFNKLLSENSLKFQIERTYLKKEDIEKQEFEKKEQEELQKKQTLIKEFSIISSISIKEAIQLLMKKLVKIAKQRKKEEEERRIKELENAEALKKEIKGNKWLVNINNIILNEKFFQIWLKAALEIMQKEQNLQDKVDFKLSLLQIETPIAEWMDLFKPMILISGEFRLDKLANGSPTHLNNSPNNRKSLHLKKSEVLKKKNTFSLNSFDCFLHHRKYNRLIWDISPDNSKQLKSSDLTDIDYIAIEFLDEGNSQTGSSYQKERSHRIQLKVAFLKEFFKRTRTNIIWIPLKIIGKISANEEEFLYLKVFNSEFQRKNHELFKDEITRNRLSISDIDLSFLSKRKQLFENIFKEAYEISLNKYIENEGHTYIKIESIREIIREKYHELSFKGYWSTVEKFLNIFELSQDDIKTLSLNGMPNFIRRKMWGLKNRDKNREVLEYLLSTTIKTNNDLDIIGGVFRKKINCPDLFQKVLTQAKNENNLQLFTLINQDIKTINEDIPPNVIPLFGDIMQSLMFWAKLYNKKLIYSKNLLLLLVNIFLIFSVDNFCFHYLDNKDVKEWLIKHSFQDIQIEFFDVTNSGKITNDCFWVMVSIIYEILPDCYLIDEESQSETPIHFDLKGIRGALVVLRSYLQENFPDKMEIFEMNEGSPYGIELIFGDWFLNLMISAGFRKEFLYRLWDVLFAIDQMADKKIKCSTFIIGVISVLMIRMKNIRFKNYHEFKTYLEIYLIVLDNFEDFLNDVFKEALKINQFIAKKWHIWIDVENEILKNFNYFKIYTQMVYSFINKSQDFTQTSIPNSIPSEFNIPELPNISLHFFLYEMNIFHLEANLLIELNYNSIKKFYICNEFQKNRLNLNLYDNFPFDSSQRTLIITIYKDRSCNIINEMLIQNAEEDIEQLLKKDEKQTEICQEGLSSNEPEEFDKLYELKIDLDSFSFERVHKRIYKLTSCEKMQSYYSSEIELAVLISEKNILKESYFSKIPTLLNMNIPTVLKFSTENTQIYQEILTDLYAGLEKFKHFGIIMSERAENSFFLLEDSFSDLYLDFPEFLKRMNSCGFDNEVAIRWIYEGLKILSGKEKKYKINGVLLPEFAGSIFLFSQEKALQFLCCGDIKKKIPVLTFKLFLKYLYNFLGFYESHHYLENFFDFLQQNCQGNARILKAYLTFGEANPKLKRFNVKEILVELSVKAHESFGSKDILFGDDRQLKVLKNLIIENVQCKEFIENFQKEKIGYMIIKYQTNEGLRSKKIIKFNNRWEIEDQRRIDSSKPTENLFYKFTNSITFNSLNKTLDFRECQKVLSQFPLLDYFYSLKNACERTHDFIEFPYLSEKLKVEIRVNSSLFISIVCPLKVKSLFVNEKHHDYFFLATRWKYYISNKFLELLKELAYQLDEEDYEELENLSENQSTDKLIETEPISIFCPLREFILLIQRRFLIYLEEKIYANEKEFLVFLEKCKAVLMMDFFQTKLRMMFKNDDQYVNISENNWNISNVLYGRKLPILVFEYLTPNLNESILKNLRNINGGGFYEIKYHYEIKENNFSYRNLAYFIYSDYSGEWLEAEIIAGKLKEKKNTSNYYKQNKVQKEDFEYFEVVFKKFPKETVHKPINEIRFMEKINLNKLII